jgi:aspartyl-tRNA(Asn)/glutamyl-tRNA(Gln) amidotransferase subunit C
MSIDKNTVRKVARLARIRTTDAEEDRLAVQMTDILKLAAELDAVNTDGVEPLTSVIDMMLPEREDKVTDGGMAEKILANAPDHTAGFFVVPKVVE